MDLMNREEAIEDLQLALSTGNYIFTKSRESLRMAISALSENKCFDGMTNGEVIQALFPKIHPCDHEQYISIYSQGSDDFFNHCQFDPKWWNAPYKKGGEKRDKSCSTCKNNDDELSGECYECLKGMFDHYEPEEVKTESEDK